MDTHPPSLPLPRPELTYPTTPPRGGGRRGAFGYPLNDEPPGLAGRRRDSHFHAQRGGLRLPAGQGEATCDMSFDYHARHAARTGSATQHVGHIARVRVRLRRLASDRDRRALKIFR